MSPLLIYFIKGAFIQVNNMVCHTCYCKKKIIIIKLKKNRVIYLVLRAHFSCTVQSITERKSH